ncbi:hypothetical protein ACO0K9_17725 [Undibacterium sp. Ji50W]|uniref:hypothetical protein n=1 Tax=Undibacterium sp. Ji50W TaxID=3413041 RepID=UPI003BF3C81F
MQAFQRYSFHFKLLCKSKLRLGRLLPVLTTLLATLFTTLLVLTGCEQTKGGKTVVLTPWLKMHQAGTGDGNKLPVTYSIRQQEKWWLLSFPIWQDLDYDEVSIINDKTILVARSVKFAKTQSADTHARLMTENDGRGMDVCTSSSAINAPANVNFIDCTDASTDKKRIVKRLSLNGKLMQTFNMPANEWEDLPTPANIAFYGDDDDAQLPYVLETARDNTYCRLIMLGKDRNTSFSMNAKTDNGKCASASDWGRIRQKHLQPATNFENLGQNLPIRKKVIAESAEKPASK